MMEVWKCENPKLCLGGVREYVRKIVVVDDEKEIADLVTTFCKTKDLVCSRFMMVLVPSPILKRSH